MALLAFDGFDHYATADLPAKYTTGFAGTIGGSYAKNGAGGLNHPGTPLGMTLQATGDTCIIGFWIQWGSFAANMTVMAVGDNDYSSAQAWIRGNADGTLSLKNGSLGGTTFGTTTWVASTGVWYHVEFKVVVSNTGSAEILVDGVSVLAVTGVDTQQLATAVWNTFYFANSVAQYDDLYVCDGSGSYNNDYLGDCIVETLVCQTSVSSPGSNAGLTPSTGSDRGANVNEAAPNGDTDYNSGVAADLKDTYRYSSMTSSGAIAGVQTLAYLRGSDQTSKTVAPVVRSNGHDHDGATVKTPAAYAYDRQVFEANPETTVPWIGPEVNQIQAGLKIIAAAGPAVSQFYLHNAAAPYTPATIRGPWDQTAGALTKALGGCKEYGGANAILTISETNATDPYNVLWGRWISGALAGQTISGTLNVVLGVSEQATAANMNFRLYVYVTQGDSDTPRGVLLDMAETLGVNEFGVTQTFKTLNAAASLSSLAITAGDRIVVEIGYVSREASATSRFGTLRYGTLNNAVFSVLDDGVAAGTDVSLKAGYIAFSVPVEESAAIAVRLSQMVVEVLALDIPIEDDPVGGGDPGVGVEPTNGTSICGAVVYKTVRVQTDSGEKRYSYGDLPLGNTFREARVLSIGAIRRALSDINGRIETARTTIVLSDYDGTLAGLAAGGVLLNKRVDVYAATDAQLRANATERRIASMIIRDFAFTGRKCSLQCEDYFGSVLGEYGSPMLVPKRLFNTTDFPNLPVQLIGKPVPIGYGLLSDESFGANAIGVVPVQFVGARRLSDGLDWDEYVLFGHAGCGWQSVFASDLRDVAIWDPASLGHGPRPVKMDLASVEGTEFLVPTHAGWTSIVGADNYVDYNGHRYSVIFVRGQRSLDARSGECPISINVGGAEDVGDGTGTLIDALWFQILHFINNWWIQSYQTGDWLAYPTVNGTYSRIATLTFDVAQLASADRLGQLPFSGGTSEIGYKGAWMIGQDLNQKPIAAAMSQLARDGDGELGIDRHGRIMASLIDASAASVKTFRDVYQEIEEGSFDANRRIAYLNNAVTIQYIPNYIPDTRPDSARTGVLWWSDFWRDHGFPAFATVEVTDATSIAAIQETRELKLEAWSLRDPPSAVDVGDRKLARREDGPIYTEFRTGLCGDDIDLGDNFLVTSEEGLAGPPGWTNKLHRCEAITYHLDEDMVLIEGQVIA